MNLYPLGKFLTHLCVHILFNVKYETLEDIPKDKGFIICCNHQTFYDPLFIAHKVKQQIRFMAKAEFFKNKISDAFFRSLGAFPVQRGKADNSAMNIAKEFISAGQVMAIFPEGTRSKDGNPHRAKPGVAMIAGMMDCGVLPVGISYKGKLGFRKKVTVRYGKMITPQELGIDPKATSTIRSATVKVMDSIVSLMDKDCYDSYGTQKDANTF